MPVILAGGFSVVSLPGSSRLLGLLSRFPRLKTAKLRWLSASTIGILSTLWYTDSASYVIIRRKETDGDWYIYLSCSEHENSKRAYKNSTNNCKSFKLDKSNAVGMGTTAFKPYFSICPVGLVWLARYCDKMHSRHLYSYGG